MARIKYLTDKNERFFFLKVRMSSGKDLDFRLLLFVQTRGVEEMQERTRGFESTTEKRGTKDKGLLLPAKNQ